MFLDIHTIPPFLYRLVLAWIFLEEGKQRQDIGTSGRSRKLEAKASWAVKRHMGAVKEGTFLSLTLSVSLHRPSYIGDFCNVSVPIVLLPIPKSFFV